MPTSRPYDPGTPAPLLAVRSDTRRDTPTVTRTAVPGLTRGGSSDVSRAVVTRGDVAIRAARTDRRPSVFPGVASTSAVTAIGEGLRALHDALPVSECPFSWSTEARIADAHHRAAQRHLDPAGWHREHRGLGVPAALQIIDAPPAIDQLVVCHGDACAHNTLIGDNGHWTAHVDLGSLGTADRWADLAVATWSTSGTAGPGGSSCCWTPTAPTPTRGEVRTTGCCGISAPEPNGSLFAATCGCTSPVQRWVRFLSCRPSGPLRR